MISVGDQHPQSHRTVESSLMIVDKQTRAAFTPLLLAFFFWILTSSLSAQTAERLTISGQTMGVVDYSVVAFGDPGSVDELKSAIHQELESVNQRMSTYIADSEVSKFNASESLDWFPVSQATADVVNRAQQISQLTDGAFDITVQPLVALWHFSKDKSDSPQIPTAAEIKTTLNRIGYQKLTVRLTPPALKKSIPDLQIDVSAIAKGYAVDQVATRLRSQSIDNFLVEVGGEVRAAGQKADEQPWKVGIEKPVSQSREPYQIVELKNQSLASSGDYRNFFEVDGKRYSHTIDPRTGYPVSHSVTATSVISQDCMTADAFATALMVLGEKEGVQAAVRADVEALLLIKQKNGITSERTNNFPAVTAQTSIESGESFVRLVGVVSVIFLIAIFAMAIGVICGRDRIKGSCGGIAALDNPDIKPECSLCSRATECKELKEALEQRNHES